jgi:c-di-GMP-binding flagellar brake protein YcgR
MRLSELTKPGDKIDIQLLQQLEQQEHGKTAGAIRTCKSSVFDFLDEDSIEIAMPTENGKMVLFQIGLRCKMLFYTQKGLFTCTAVVQRRYKSDNLFVLSMQLKTDPVKFQRREFFRIECMIEMDFIPIEEEIAKLNSTEQIFGAVSEVESAKPNQKAKVMDISGGGIRFSTEETLQPDTYILTMIRLSNDKIDQMFYLVTQILESELSTNGYKYMNRAKFLFKDLRDRETIVRYVFEEERRIRRKENR